MVKALAGRSYAGKAAWAVLCATVAMTTQVAAVSCDGTNVWIGAASGGSWSNAANWEAVVTDIPSARDESGLVENTYTVGFDTGYNFFKLRVDQR